MTTDYVIETEGLGKRYGNRPAVDALSFRVPMGVVAGFVGPNGAGKTTTMSMLLGLVRPTAGGARVLGRPLDESSAYLPRIGALIESPAFYPGLTGEENLQLLATVGGHDPSQAVELLSLVGLGNRGGDRFGAYSMGMKQRLGIAAALLGDPALLILDEPTNGLDPAGIHEMRQLIRQLADGGRTVFVSSHILAELEQVCDWFVIIDHGSLVYQGSKADLLTGAEATLVIAPEHSQDLERLEQLVAARGRTVKRQNGELVIDVTHDDPRPVAADLNRSATAAGLVLVELRLERMNLEERYLAMTNGGRQ